MFKLNVRDQPDNRSETPRETGSETSIKLSMVTRDRLKDYGKKGETYDALINRFFDDRERELGLCFKDNALSILPAILEDIDGENRRQINKWGLQERTLPEWQLFLTEEIGELSQAIGEYHYRDGTLEEIYREAVQCATLCIKIAEMVKCRQIELLPGARDNE